MLDGMFSFVLLDTRDNSFVAARDAIGITSLYIGWGLDGETISLIERFNCSESMKLCLLTRKQSSSLAIIQVQFGFHQN